MLDRVLKYDNKLRYNKKLDGSVSFIRQSPFNTFRNHDILTFQNQYIGSCRWIRNKLIMMDTTRFDIVGDTIRTNIEARRKRDDDRVHRELGSFFASGGESFVV